jgi:F-type H+-transporting ATPase subunit epsilon
MATTYHLNIVTPERVLLSEEVVETNAPGTQGYLGILAHHAPLMTELLPGEVHVTLSDERTTKQIVVSGGFLEMSPEGKATILADQAEPAAEIDLTRAQKDLEAARQMLESADTSAAEQAEARAALTHAEARLRAGRSNRLE